MRSHLLLAASLVALAACAAPGPEIGPDGRPVPKVYRISANDAAQVQQRTLEAVNSLRQASGATPLQLNQALNAAAATHSRDMSKQSRPWHFGSDGSSPLDRVARAGYQGRFIGENISETYETELETVAAWMSQPDTRVIMLDPSARELGFSFYQEQTGKIWWTLITGG